MTQMYFYYLLCSLLIIIIFIRRWSQSEREIAITIDDVPTDRATFEKINEHLNHYNAPATMFAIANRLNEDEFAYLQQIKSEQTVIGNHTFSHKKLAVTSAEDFIKDIAKADEILSPLMSRHRYFRYPYLSTGKWFKKLRVMRYLKAKNYTIAPVTVRSLDVRFDRQLMEKSQTPVFLEEIKNKYLTYVWKRTLRSEKKFSLVRKKQILLIHANTLNALFLGDLLNMFKKNGYRFITLDKAMGLDNAVS